MGAFIGKNSMRSGLYSCGGVGIVVKYVSVHFWSYAATASNIKSLLRASKAFEKSSLTKICFSGIECKYRLVAWTAASAPRDTQTQIWSINDEVIKNLGV